MTMIHYLSEDKKTLSKMFSHYYKKTGSTQHEELFVSMATATILGGQAIMEVYKKKNVNVFTKKGKKVTLKESQKNISALYKTEADTASHTAILNILGKKHYHNIPLLYEESSTTHKVSNTTYIAIDELDGTGRFMKGKPGFTVLIHYVKNGKQVLSTCFDPEKEEFYYAIAGKGSYIDQERVLLHNNTTTLHTAHVVIPGNTQKQEEYILFLKKQFNNLTTGLATGSRIAGILKGNFDTFINEGSETLYPWDLAMILNLVEAGGIATTKTGSSILFSTQTTTKNIICSTNRILHEEVLKNVV